MKSKLYILILALITFGCNSDDDAQQDTNATLNGSWSLINVSGGFAGVDDDFEIGLITWDFDNSNLKLTVTNNNTEEVIYDGLSSGDYDFQVLTTTGEVGYLVIHNHGIDHAITTLTTSQLILDEGVAADGFLLTFSR